MIGSGLYKTEVEIIQAFKEQCQNRQAKSPHGKPLKTSGS